MRQIRVLLATLAALSLLTGCTTFQAKEAGRAVAGGLFEMALDIATDGPERRLEERRRWEDNPANRWSACLSPCDIGRDRPTQAELEEEARRKRLAEAEQYEAEVDEIMQTLVDQAEFDEFMEELEAAEQHSGDPPSTSTTDQ